MEIEVKNIINFVFIYFIVWWVIVFFTLPFAIKRDENPDFKGNSSAAPKKHNLKIKFLITSILSLLATIVIQQYWEVIFPVGG